MPKKSRQINREKAQKLAEVRERAGLTWTEVARYLGYTDYETIKRWEKGKASPGETETKRSGLIDLLLNKYGLGSDEAQIKEFLQLWDDLMVMEWEWQPLSLGELEVYLEDKVDIRKKLFEVLTPRFPLQRPEPVEFFVGREEELNRLVGLLQPGQVVTLCGPPGVGKTALAIHALWTLAPANKPPDHFPDGIIWHNFYAKPKATSAMEDIVLAFGEKPQPNPQAAAQRVLAFRQALLVLDGAEWTEELDQVLALRSRCGVLIISTEREQTRGMRLNLDPLSLPEAVSLLQVRGGPRSVDTAAVEQICNLLERFPLLILQAARKIDKGEERASDYLAWLMEEGIEALDVEDRYRRVLKKNLDRLSNMARQALAIVGILAPASFEARVMTAALELSLPKTIHILGDLVAYNLLRRPENSYTITHTLFHYYVSKELAPPTEVVNRLANYYLTLVKEQTALGLAGLPILDAERPHVLTILIECQQREEWQATRDLAWAVGSEEQYLDLQSHWTEGVTANESGLRAAQKLGNRADEVMFLGNLGVYHRNLGQFLRAIEYHEQALAISQEIGNREAEGKQLNNLGLNYRNLGKTPQAIEYHQQALAISQETKNRRNEHIALGSLGIMNRIKGHLAEAITSLTQALTIAQTVGDRRNEAVWASNLGLAYSDLDNEDNKNNQDKAIYYHQQALAAAQETGTVRVITGTLGNIGIAYGRKGDHEQALNYFQQALTIQQRMGDRLGEGNQLNNIGLTYKKMGKLKQARNFYNNAWGVYKNIGNVEGQADVRVNWAEWHIDQGHYWSARRYLEQARRIYRKVGSPKVNYVEAVLDKLDELENNIAKTPEDEPKY